ncbi:MAG: TOMM precursor leader peptide-binding protein [Cyanobium sp.]
MYEPIVDPDGGLFLFCESQARPLHLRGAIYAQMAAMLDGRHRIDDIYALMADRHSHQSIFMAITRLLRLRVLVEDNQDPQPEQASAWSAYWELMGANPGRVRRNIGDTAISVRGFGSLSGEHRLLEELLQRQGFRVMPRGDLTLVLSDNYLHPELERWNREALAQQQRWLLIRPVGIETWLGPAFQPGDSACWECLAHRLRWHRRLERHLEHASDGCGPIGLPRARHDAVMVACLAQAVEAISRWIGCEEPPILHNRVVVRDSRTWESQIHELRRRPQCPACGGAPMASSAAEADPIQLGRRSSRGLPGSGLRTQSPEEVLRQLQPHLSPITGIIHHVQQGRLTAERSDVEAWPTPVFIADHNFSDMGEENHFLREGLRRRAGGKGTTKTQALVSALAESVERYCGVFDGTEPRLRASFHQLADRAIHPNACMGFSERQFLRREVLNRKRHKAYWVPCRLDHAQPIDWTPLWSLTRQRTVLLPTSLCYFGYRTPDPLCAYADSNGCASGSCIEEALLQGLLELVERDAVAIWWYNRLARPGIDLASVNDSYISLVVDHYKRIRRDVWVLDVSSDIGIPTFAALSKRVDQPQEDIIYGFGCHPVPRLAVVRALTELNQSLEAVPCATDPATSQRHLGTPEVIHWWRTVTVASEPYLLPDLERSAAQLAHATVETDDLTATLRDCLDRVERAGIEVLSLNQTRPDIGFPVVRVIAPGLRHFWPRFAPGRVYEVPVQQGWRSTPLREEEFNPHVVHF